MSKAGTRTIVADRLESIADEYKTAAHTLAYVESGREVDERPSTEALLTTLRIEPTLALEIRDGMGRDVIGALVDHDGVARYPVWSHSAAKASAGLANVQDLTLERQPGARNLLENPRRYPIVRLRDSTPLAELEAPPRWQAIDGPGDLRGGP